jgi:hypothetical protein
MSIYVPIHIYIYIYIYIFVFCYCFCFPVHRSLHRFSTGNRLQNVQLEI